MDGKNKTASACSGPVWGSTEQNTLIRDGLAQQNESDKAHVPVTKISLCLCSVFCFPKFGQVIYFSTFEEVVLERE